MLESYQRVRLCGLAGGRRVGLHQLFPLLAHVVLLGGGNAGQVRVAARRALNAQL